MHLHYCFVGVNGIGKSALVRKVCELNPAFQPISGSKELMSWLKIPGDRIAFRAMSQEKKSAEWSKCLEEIHRRYREHNLIVDAHVLNMVRGKVINLETHPLAGFDALVLVDATAEQVVRRIHADKERSRDLFPERASVSEELEVMRSYLRQTKEKFKAAIAEHNLPALVLTNSDGSVDLVAQQFLEFDAKLRKGIVTIPSYD